MDSIIKEYQDNRDAYVLFTGKIERLIADLLQESSISYQSISSRPKDIDSLSEKIARKQGKYKKLSDITDLCGVRIITYYSDEVDRIAQIIENEFVVDRENTIDKRKAVDPDRFGYMSLHYVVELNDSRAMLTEHKNFKGYKFEIQIRTILQHTWAEIEHDLGYKSKDTIPNDIKRDFFRLSGLLELADKEFLNIRHTLTNYTNFVNRELQKDNVDVDILIDDVSVKAFLETNRDAIELGEKVARKTGHRLVKSTAFDVSGITNRLIWVGCKTIGDVKLALKEHYQSALYIAENYIGNAENSEDNRICDDVGLFFLCYSILSVEGSPERIVSYWDETGTVVDGTDKVKSAQEIISLFNEHKQ